MGARALTKPDLGFKTSPGAMGGQRAPQGSKEISEEAAIRVQTRNAMVAAEVTTGLF